MNIELPTGVPFVYEMNKNYKELILKTKGRKEFIEKQISKTQNELFAYSHKLELVEKAQIFLQEEDEFRKLQEKHRRI